MQPGPVRPVASGCEALADRSGRIGIAGPRGGRRREDGPEPLGGSARRRDRTLADLRRDAPLRNRHLGGRQGVEREGSRERGRVPAAWRPRARADASGGGADQSRRGRYLDSRPAAELQSPEAFEAEWKRVGDVLRADLAAPSPDALSGVRPAAARAVAEVARLQLREYYDASLEYGRNTMAAVRALLRRGGARAARLRRLRARTLRDPDRSRCRRCARSLPSSTRLEDALLAAYRPPASIDRHADFIGASASLKEARELDAAGLRYGALLHYLQAAQRLPIAACGRRRRREQLDAFADERLADSPTRRTRSAALPRARPRPARHSPRIPAPPPRPSPTTCFPATSPRSSPAPASARAKTARRGDGHARALALHLKPLRSGKFAGPERRAEFGGQARFVSENYGDSELAEALRRDALSRRSSWTTCSSRRPRTSASTARARARRRPLHPVQERREPRAVPGRPRAHDRADPRGRKDAGASGRGAVGGGPVASLPAFALHGPRRAAGGARRSRRPGRRSSSSGRRGARRAAARSPGSAS